MKMKWILTFYKKEEKKQSFYYKSLISKAQCVSMGTCISISILNQVFNIPVCLSLFISDFKTFHRFSCLPLLLVCTLFRSLNLLHDEIKYIETNVDFLLISHEIKSHSLLKCVYSLHMHLEDVKREKSIAPHINKEWWIQFTIFGYGTFDCIDKLKTFFSTRTKPKYPNRFE